MAKHSFNEQSTHNPDHPRTAEKKPCGPDVNPVTGEDTGHYTTTD